MIEREERETPMPLPSQHDGLSACDQSPEYAGPNAPWMPLDALSERWAAFGKEATTAFATRATSHAFAALAEEGTALRHCITASRQQRWSGATCWSERFNEHECAIRALTQAATYWF